MMLSIQLEDMTMEAATIPFTPVLALGLLVYVFTNLLKHAANQSWNAVLTILVAFAGGVAATALLAATDFSAGIVIGGTTLADLNFASVIVVGLVIGATASGLYDAKTAIDNHDSAATPHLLPSSARDAIEPGEARSER